MKSHLKNILVPVDFNDSSLIAVKYASDIARRIDGRLFLIYIIETKGLIEEFLQSGNELVKLTEHAKTRLDQLASEISKSENIEVETRVERGKIYRKILDLGEEIQARFIVLGENHPYSEINHSLGSTVFQVTLKSAVPVVIVKGEKTSFGNKFVVPLDLTKQTQRQLIAAIAYGRNYDAEMNLVSAKIANIKMRNSLIQKKLKSANKTLAENGVKSTCRLYEYSSETLPYKRVLEYAEEIKADTILVLTHQEGYTYDNYIGAFAHHIINESPIPVISLTASAVTFKMENFLIPILDPVGFLFKNEKKFRNIE
jgi:nucleotide-binding universal stress UspA family protein